jgi:hypothetical protein
MKSDFNGDGKADVLWQNSSGARAIWLMNGTTYTSEPRRRPGTSEITDRQRLASVGCLTDPVELSKSNLVGHWHYESGAKPNAQGGQLFAEFANPSTLLREKVE